ncbi:MAG: polysaccharide pyruvyl transferase family protein [Myxococcales bacterium]|nr:polysaccharide pyruvyl transferase family protein [Myxococcales bacterium]
MVRERDETDIEGRASVWSDLWSRARDVADRVKRTVDADTALQTSMAGLIELAATRYALDPGSQYRPGRPLRLLFAGYSGTRNTGADVRVEEMIRQVRHLLTDEHCELFVTTIDPARSQGYFRAVTQLELPQIFPRFVFETVHQMHGVIACEGSMFKSKFANALSTYMVGALGCATAENKVAVGWGGEAGAMDDSLRWLVERYCSDALVMCRNPESRELLDTLGVPTEAGTDTAWTFSAGPEERARADLAALGWDGRAPVLAVCPINPFWWPVKPDVLKGAVHALTGAHAEAHYKSVYFHASGPEVRRKQATYLDGLAEGIEAFRQRRDCFVVVVGMEALDREACEGLAERLGGAPVLVSDEVDMYRMVAVLRASAMVLSSRYHAIVCSMPARVPSAGVTMDERIRNLMADRRSPELALEVDDPHLAESVTRVLHTLNREAERVADGIGRCVVDNLVRMGCMGQVFVDHLRELHPDLPLRPDLGRSGDPWAHLPTLSAETERLAERYG